ncbi:hypothetical protein AgCh_004265 [Apium graveolens]
MPDFDTSRVMTALLSTKNTTQSFDVELERERGDVGKELNNNKKMKEEVIIVAESGGSGLGEDEMNEKKGRAGEGKVKIRE